MSKSDNNKHRASRDPNPSSPPPWDHTMPALLKIFAVGRQSRLYILSPLLDKQLPPGATRVIEREMPNELIEQLRYSLDIKDNGSVPVPVYHWLRVAIVPAQSKDRNTATADYLHLIPVKSALAAATSDEIRLLARAARGQAATMPDPLEPISGDNPNPYHHANTAPDIDEEPDQ